MSIISFLRDAGEKLFGSPEPTGAAPDARPSTDQESAAAPVDALNRRAAEAIRRYLDSKGLAVEKLRVDYAGATTTVTVSGNVPDQATREKIVLLAGNVANVHHVNDQLSVVGTGGNGGAASDFYEVEPGDSLSTIAQDVYGAADKSSVIFEANKPMLSDPDRIYPGQKLRIPRLS